MWQVPQLPIAASSAPLAICAASNFVSFDGAVVAAVSAVTSAPEAHDEPDIPDDRLRLIFTCCHPGLAVEAQVGLTLRLVCGLTTEVAIVESFVTDGETWREHQNELTRPFFSEYAMMWRFVAKEDAFDILPGSTEELCRGLARYARNMRR